MSLYFKILGYILGFVLILVGVAFWLKGYLAIGIDDSLQVPRVVISQDEQVVDEFDLMNLPEYEIEEVLRDLYVPWSIVFVNDSRMLIAQRNGEILEAFSGDLIDSWELSERPLYIFEGVSQRSEEGLMGLTIHPKFEENGFIYTCVAYEKATGMNIKIERLQDQAGVGIVEKETIFEGIPGARFHAGCRLRFGPDSKLYVTTGDAAQRNLSQDMNSLAGKLLRLNNDGSIPTDNPFENSPIWSLGHRNSQGIDWHPVSEILVSSEHGPSVFDGPAGGDEVNIIKKGENYGWPIVSHERSDEKFVDPLIVMTPATAPASGVFYDGEVFPQFYGNYFAGLLVGEGILRVIFDSKGEELVGYMKLPEINVGRVRDVAVGPDGAIYFSSSNTDGRGNIIVADDKIYKLIPKK